MELKELLIAGAVKDCGCAEGLAQLDGVQSKEDMVQCFLDRIDFCLARDFPAKSFIKKHFGAGLLEKKGLYIDRRVELHNTNGVFLGNCSGSLSADGYAVCRLYVKHHTSLEIAASGHAFVMADVLDEAEVNIRCEEHARVVVNLYARAKAGGTGEGQIKIVHKNKETYEL